MGIWSCGDPGVLEAQMKASARYHITDTTCLSRSSVVPRQYVVQLATNHDAGRVCHQPCWCLLYLHFGLCLLHMLSASEPTRVTACSGVCGTIVQLCMCACVGMCRMECGGIIRSRMQGTGFLVMLLMSSITFCLTFSSHPASPSSKLPALVTMQRPGVANTGTMQNMVQVSLTILHKSLLPLATYTSVYYYDGPAQHNR